MSTHLTYRFACMFGVSVAWSVLATDYTWQGGSGFFSDTAMWSPAGSPSDGDRAKFSTATEGVVSWTDNAVNNEMQII